MSDVSRDTVFCGNLRISQSLDGYRFSIDPVLLASHAGRLAGHRVVDLGTGCGIIPLLIGSRRRDTQIYGIEVQPGLADVAASNVRENRMDDRITILCENMTRVDCTAISGPVDTAVSNPPYVKVRSGRINPNPERAKAKHEIDVTLKDVVQTAYRLLRNAGRFIMIYAADRMVDALMQMRTCGIEPKFVRIVQSDAVSAAKRFLVEGLKGGRPGLTIASPLTIFQPDGEYTEEVRRMMAPASFVYFDH
jgi:tRNA1Val (adenine37-N6)-methyltransferase